MLLIGLMFPAQVTILPIYLGYAKVGLLNRPIGLALMYLTSSFGVFLIRQFMLSQPKALEEAALMDGAGYFKIFWRISLPQLRPALSALGIITFTQTWNYYFQAKVLLGTQTAMTLPLAMDVLRGYLGLGQPLGGDGGDEHVGPAGDAALSHRPEIRDRGDHDERHQDLRIQDFLCGTTSSRIDHRFAYTESDALRRLPARRRRRGRLLDLGQRAADRLVDPQPAGAAGLQRLLAISRSRPSATASSSTRG